MYECEPCDFESRNKYDYTRHMNTDKHFRIIADLSNTNKTSKGTKKTKISKDSKDSKEPKKGTATQPKIETQTDSSSLICMCGHCKMKFSEEDIYAHTETCRVMLIEKKLSEKTMEMSFLKTHHESDMKVAVKVAVLETQLQTEREAKKEIVGVKNEIVEILKEENLNKNQVLNKVSTTASNATSALKYITTHYSNAPPLAAIPLKDYSKIIDSAENQSDIMVQHFQDDTLHEYLGNMLIKLFKKDDPTIQALWNSDAARQTFLIKTLEKWTVDKKGLGLTDTVINPFLIHIQNMLLAHKNKVYDSTLIYISKVEKLQQEVYKWDRSMKVAKERGPRPNYDDKIKKLNTDRQKLDMSVILYANLIMQIGMDKLTGPILKYISPFFSIDKNGNTNNQKKLTFNEDKDPEEEIDEEEEKEIPEDGHENKEIVEVKQEEEKEDEEDDDDEKEEEEEDVDDDENPWAMYKSTYVKKPPVQVKKIEKLKKTKKNEKPEKPKKKKAMVV